MEVEQGICKQREGAKHYTKDDGVVGQVLAALAQREGEEKEASVEAEEPQELDGDQEEDEAR